MLVNGAFYGGNENGSQKEGLKEEGRKEEGNQEEEEVTLLALVFHESPG